MKFESFSNLYLIISVLVPGFIYNGVLLNFMPLRQDKEKELIILRLLTATAVNYAVSSPLIYLLVSGHLFNVDPSAQAACWLLILFVMPLLLGVLHAELLQHRGLNWLYQMLRLRPINPIPTGWDWIFGRTQPCFVLVTLTDGTEIPGYFGQDSLASSDPDRRDIFIQRVYTVPPEGEAGAWEPVPHTLGIYVSGAQMASIEFRGSHE